MATTVSLGKLSTIEEYCEGGDSVTFTYSSLSLNDMIDDNAIEFPVFNVYDDYIDELASMCKTVNLTQEEYLEYYQAPKLLANRVYKNSELDFLIMRLNGIYDPKEFTFRTISLISATDLSAALSKIKTANKSFIDTYNQDNPLG
jgi:hypothetical protein